MSHIADLQYPCFDTDSGSALSPNEGRGRGREGRKRFTEAGTSVKRTFIKIKLMLPPILLLIQLKQQLFAPFWAGRLASG